MEALLLLIGIGNIKLRGDISFRAVITVRTPEENKVRSLLIAYRFILHGFSTRHADLRQQSVIQSIQDMNAVLDYKNSLLFNICFSLLLSPFTQVSKRAASARIFLHLNTTGYCILVDLFSLQLIPALTTSWATTFQAQV